MSSTSTRTGKRVTDPDVLGRIRALAVPPAWSDVWVCPLPAGHIQATGTDAKGRRQYRYHDVWRLHRDREKFDHMLDSARDPQGCAPRAWRTSRNEGSRETGFSCAVRLLDLGFFRIGTEGYAEQNQTFGLATIRKRRVDVTGNVVTFGYKAKNGKRRIQSIVDPQVASVVAALKRRAGGGDERLAYRRGRMWVDVRSADINAYMRELSESDSTAKDFRTWNATVLAAVVRAVSEQATSAAGRTRAMTRAMQEVARYLGNTPAVSRSPYVDRRVVDRSQAGLTIDVALEAIGEDVAGGQPSTQGAIERAVLALLTDDTPLRAAA